MLGFSQFNRVNRLGMAGGSLPYYQRVKNLFGANLIGYWPLWDASGVTAVDISGNNRNGTYYNIGGVLTGVTLGQADLGNGHPSAGFDGTGNMLLYSAALASAFNGQEGFCVITVKPSSAGVWTDGVVRPIVSLYADASNAISFYKPNTANNITWSAVAGGVVKSGGATLISRANRFQLGVTWSKANDRVGCYYQGQLVGGSYITGFGLWSGTLSTTRTMIGANNPGIATGWTGLMAETIIGSREATSAEMWQICKLNMPSTRISVTGDSIAVGYGGYIPWPSIIGDGYNDHALTLNRAIGGRSITDNFDIQTGNIANDDADIIVNALGTNDNNAGDMAVLQATVERNLAAQKISNPRARIFYMNVLPRWTDATGATPVDKSNIRAAIAAGCVAQGITCWDTLTDPWITASDTSDGLHANTSGQQKIATRILALL